MLLVGIYVNEWGFMRQEDNKIILTQKEFSDIRGYNKAADELIKIKKEFLNIRECNELVDKLNRLVKLQDEKIQLLERHSGIGYYKR